MAALSSEQTLMRDQAKSWATKQAPVEKFRAMRDRYLALPIEQEVDLPGDVTMTMVLIPPGEFTMGSTEEEKASRWPTSTSRSCACMESKARPRQG